MHGGLLCGGENASGFNDVICTSISPLNLGGVHLSKDGDGLAINGNFLFASGLDCARKPAVDGVVLEHVFHVVGGDEGVVDGDNVDHGIVLGGTHDKTSDTSKAVNTNVDRLQRVLTSIAVDNVSKLGLQRSTSDEESINVRLARQSRCRLSRGATSVQNTCLLRNIRSGNLTQVLTKIRMRLLGLIRSGNQTSSNSPDWLVSNHNIVPILGGKHIGIRLDLRKDIVVRGTSLACLEGFPTASNDLESLVQSVLGLGGDFRVGFTLAATFGVASEGPGDTHVLEHIGGGFASVGAVAAGPHVLGTDGDIAAESFLDALDVQLGWAHYHFSVGGEGGLVDHGD
mmetsp:Transcript_4797/g.10923  ORF Transcript_4797/g.10923 Transcript_4797/m.10923 type:complete len:342 (-) Transcript_4797:200-1225(-)